METVLWRISIEALILLSYRRILPEECLSVLQKVELLLSERTLAHIMTESIIAGAMAELETTL